MYLWPGLMRSEPLQWSEETNDASDSLAVRGKLGDIEAIGQRRSVNLDQMPGKAGDSVVHVNGTRTYHPGSGSTSDDFFNVSEQLRGISRVNSRVGIRRLVRPDLSEPFSPSAGTGLAPDRAVAIDQLGQRIRLGLFTHVTLRRSRMHRGTS